MAYLAQPLGVHKGALRSWCVARSRRNSPAPRSARQARAVFEGSLTDLVDVDLLTVIYGKA